MQEKIIARFVLGALVFFGITVFLERTSFVSQVVESQVEAGKVAEPTAPKVAATFEYGLAAVVAFFVATSQVGGVASQGLIYLWNFAKSGFKVAVGRVSSAHSQDASGTTSGAINVSELGRILQSLDERLSNLEKPSPAEPDGERSLPLQGAILKAGPDFEDVARDLFDRIVAKLDERHEQLSAAIQSMKPKASRSSKKEDGSES
jgi:hypothetical protein